jgi:hypothetical protein
VKLNPHQRVKLQLAAVAASAIVVMVAVAVAALGQQASAPEAGGQMNIGQTSTSTTAPAAIGTSFARPAMKAQRPNGF